MNDFFVAVISWLLAGIAVAILAVNHSMEKQKDSKRGAHIAMGAGLGLLLGVVLNSCSLWDHILCIVLGFLWGMVVASLILRKGQAK